MKVPSNLRAVLSGHQRHTLNPPAHEVTKGLGTGVQGVIRCTNIVQFQLFGPVTKKLSHFLVSVIVKKLVNSGGVEKYLRFPSVGILSVSIPLLLLCLVYRQGISEYPLPELALFALFAPSPATGLRGLKSGYAHRCSSRCHGDTRHTQRSHRCLRTVCAVAALLRGGG
jgi:hypothetical protein